MQRYRKWILAPLFAGFGILLISITSYALRPTNIGLTRFEAFVTGDSVRLEWDVETEVGTGGYKLKRGQNGTFAYLPDTVNGGDLIITALGGPSQGHNYSHIDEDVIIGTTYTYQLIELTTSSNEVVQGEATVTVQVIATNTPIVLPTSNPNPGAANQNNAATPTPLPTALPTAVRPTTAPPPTTLPPAAAAAPTSLPAQPTTTNDQPAAPAAQNDSLSDDPYPAAPESSQASAATEPEAFAVGVAAAQEQPPDQGAYPAPGAAENGQPNIANDTAVSADTAAAPEQLPGGVTAPVVISGAPGAPPPNTVSQTSADTAVQEPQPESGGLAFLWVAFIAALTIFIAAVFGAIILYSRNRQSG
jgi:hypothetical protein